MLQFDEYKVKLNNLAPTLEELGRALDLESAERELDMLQAESAADGFWNNLAKAQKVQQRIKVLQTKVDSQRKRKQQWDDLMALCEMGNEFEDESLIPELEEGYAHLEEDMEQARLQTLLTGEYDSSNVILTIHPGAGGTEAQDWAQMLYRMYTRWTERHGFTYQIMDYQDGDEAGIKSATIMIEGENAYGYLRGEHGVHRLVRVSPFDANARRQTSFASVEVMPDLPEDVEVEIRPEDIDLVKPEDGTLQGVVTHLIFKGVHYEMEVTTPDGFEWLVHSTDMFPVGQQVGIHVEPFEIQIMNKPASEDEEALGVNE